MTSPKVLEIRNATCDVTHTYQDILTISNIGDVYTCRFLYKCVQCNQDETCYFSLDLYKGNNFENRNIYLI